MEQLKQKLIDCVNESKLPAEAVYFVVKDFYRDILDSYEVYKKQAEAAKGMAAAQVKEETE